LQHLDAHVHHRARSRGARLAEDPRRGHAVPPHLGSAVPVRRPPPRPVDREGEAAPRFRGRHPARHDPRRGDPVDRAAGGGAPPLMGPRLRPLWVTPALPRLGVAAARERWWALLARLTIRHDVTLLAFVDPEDVGAEADLPPGLAAVHQVPKAPWQPDDP